MQCAISASTFGAVQVVYSNNPLPGDNFVNVSGPETGQAVGSTGWYYNNVRAGSTIGINTTYPNAGNGSVYLEGTIGPSGSPTSKGDIEYYSATPLGKFSDLTSLSYDWYRDSVSTNSNVQHPSLRLILSNPSTNALSYLIFERAYNVAGAVPVDQWVTDIITGTSKLWSNNLLAPTTMYDTLTNWMNTYGDYNIIGLSSGFGSGWGPFVGAVDNITLGINGNETTYNFEVGAVPEPMSFVVWGVMAVCGAAFARKVTKKGLPA